MFDKTSTPPMGIGAPASVPIEAKPSILGALGIQESRLRDLWDRLRDLEGRLEPILDGPDAGQYLDDQSNKPVGILGQLEQSNIAIAEAVAKLEALMRRLQL